MATQFQRNGNIPSAGPEGDALYATGDYELTAHYLERIVGLEKNLAVISVAGQRRPTLR